MFLAILAAVFIVYLVVSSEKEVEKNNNIMRAKHAAWEASRPKKPQYYPGTQSEWELEEVLREGLERSIEKDRA